MNPTVRITYLVWTAPFSGVVLLDLKMRSESVPTVTIKDLWSTSSRVFICGRDS